ncbi:MAG TPA: hypothetical protein VNR70_12760 [Steroidobacteraceae bacterium]|jgi:hypothetical protein|nr:hypothetical protein [Steroidobacteraceae bacterium]
MSRKDEDRILHGLHYFRESLDEEFTVTSDQILWLAAHAYADGSGWYKDGDLQSFDCSVIPIELRRKLLMSKFELPLRYLHYRRLIKLTHVGEDVANVAVTFAGADRAMRLHTRVGRMEVWYQEHKDGFLGLVTTIAVSFITALAAVAVLERLHRSFAEPPRMIYEAEPKSQP